MVGLQIKQCSIIEIECAATFEALADEYAVESAIDGLPEPTRKLDQYKQLEHSGAIFPLAAYYDDELIGFCGVVMPTIPHYGVLVAVTESLFVAKAKRHTGAGLRLIARAQKLADDANSPGLLVSSTVGSDLEKILPEIGFVKTNSVFFRKRTNA